jgi:hypothetical protein
MKRKKKLQKKSLKKNFSRRWDLNEKNDWTKKDKKLGGIIQHSCNINQHFLHNDVHIARDKNKSWILESCQISRRLTLCWVSSIRTLSI